MQWNALTRTIVFTAVVGSGACRGNYSSTNEPPPSSSADQIAVAQTAPGASTTGTFYALPPAAYVNKIKTLLIGLPPTDQEVAAVVADPSQLASLIDGWMNTATYKTTMLGFFSSAFQQNLATAYDYTQNNIEASPRSATQKNLRDSFAMTVWELSKLGQPFTQVATTRQFMMTTAQMSAYAFYDTQLRDDSGTASDSHVTQNPGYHFALERQGSQVSLASSVNPSDPNFMTFYFPGLANFQSTNPQCIKNDPFIINGSNCYQGPNAISRTLWNLLQGDGFRYEQPASNLSCYTRGINNFLVDTDYNDWRMVTIRPPAVGEITSNFFDLTALRQSATLVLNTPRVGFFTTLPFLAQWYTNFSNQARVTINQTLITGLAHAFDGTDTVAIAATAALDAAHAADPACFACHQNLDPMRQFFRHDYTLYFTPQGDSRQKNILPTFAFDNVVASGHSIYDLGDQIAQHPRFAIAWTHKLCMWANSAPCSESDPEFVRVANVFKQSNFSWPMLVRTLLSSPLVTYSTPTSTAILSGQPTSVTRMEHLCRILDARLNLNDFCGLNSELGGQPGSTLAAALPYDFYSRGAVDAVLVTQPSLMFRTTMENICAQVADKVVDTGANALLSSSDVTPSITFLVKRLMGVGSQQVSQPNGILTTHYANALAAGASASEALKSTFIAACLSPYVTSIGL